MIAAALLLAAADSRAEGDWLTRFHAFTPMHFLAVTVCFAAMAAASVLGRRWRGTPREERFRRGWGIAVLAYSILTSIWWVLPGNWDLGTSLPLHLCDVSIFIAAGAMLTKQRVLRSLLYFWGIGLSTQAFVTPTLQEGVADWRFWLFWIGHVMIVGSAIYDVAVGMYRPRFRDLVASIAIGVGYIAMLMGINIAFGLNYGYVGETDPSTRTVIQSLGPWPWRVGVMILMAVAVFTVLWAVWPISRRLTRAEPPNQSSSQLP